MLIRDVQATGCSESKGMQSFTYGFLCRRRVAPVLDAIFSKPNSCLLFFILYLFLFQNLIRGHCPGMVTNGGSVTHKYFHINEKDGS
jgi:hypothetical protein